MKTELNIWFWKTEQQKAIQLLQVFLNLLKVSFGYFVIFQIYKT